MNSFDVFDTLLARRYITSKPIWQYIEDTYAITKFSIERQSADTGTRNLYEIYDALVNNNVISLSQRDELVNLEIHLEKENSFPVQENINKVADGDILISDMYLPASAILELVRGVGLTKQVTLYQSNSDKSQGTVYKKFLDNKPEYHLGDNEHSDYIQAKSNNINGCWYPGTGLTVNEKKIKDSGALHVAFLCREIRLRQARVNDFFSISCGINLPWLLVCAETVYRKYKNRNIVFLGRDCQLLHKIYSTYYGVCYYLPFSRKVAHNQPKDAVNYLLTHSPENPLFFDISSTGATWSALETHGDLDIVVAIYSDSAFYTKTKPVLPKKFNYLTCNTEVGATNLTMEIFNCGNHGHLKEIKVIDGKLMQVIFGDHELPNELVETIHQPINAAVDLKNYYQHTIREELSSLTDTQLFSLYKMFINELCSYEHIADIIPNFSQVEGEYLNLIRENIQ